MRTMSDWELLQDYVKTRSEAAFAELVQRHIDWAFSVAVRRVRWQAIHRLPSLRRFRPGARREVGAWGPGGQPVAGCRGQAVPTPVHGICV